jgi:hypothetical protein
VWHNGGDDRIIVNGMIERDFKYTPDDKGNTVVSWGDPNASFTLIGVTTDMVTA